jgi:hypothetical protein
MKKSLYLIVGSVIVVGAIIFLRKKKVTDDKIKTDETAKAEAKLKNDFIIAVNQEAEAMNIDLINEKTANGLLKSYDYFWREIYKLGTVKANNPKLIILKKQISDLEKQAKSLGYRISQNTRSINGSSITKIV